MDKKGFTLVELLAVIAIIAIISVLAVPNIVGIADNSKKEQIVSDAKAMVSKARYMYKFKDSKYSSKFEVEDNCDVVSLKNLELDFNNPYEASSKVKICDGNYSVKLISQSFNLGTCNDSKEEIFLEEYLNEEDNITKENIKDCS